MDDGLGCKRPVRANPVRFFLVDGHEIPKTERVVARYPRFAVVEKEEESARVARDSDPRS